MSIADSLGIDEKQQLLRLARQSIVNQLQDKALPAIDSHSVSPALQTKTGCFVTLHKNGELRGCIGYLEGIEPLYQAVINNAVNAAFSDPRFPPLRDHELKDIEIEITVLTPAKKLNYQGSDDLLTKLTPSVDGIIIKKGYHQATFLPQVWDQLPQKEDFLGHLCMKAGLPATEWKKGELTVLIYHAFYFDEHTMKP
ncbi:MAG: AmmeMemoRadiSam system protein A [Candidatus Delongbacteria bacterium]|nr:AmmeMemoRadiSam system protein A [Candidatus Delongbacteria bacterium]